MSQNVSTSRWPQREALSGVSINVLKGVSALEGVHCNVTKLQTILQPYMGEGRANLGDTNLSPQLSTGEVKRLEVLRSRAVFLGIVLGVMALGSFFRGATPTYLEAQAWQFIVMSNEPINPQFLMSLSEVVEGFTWIIYITTAIGLALYSRALVTPFALIMPVFSASYAVLISMVASILRWKNGDEFMSVKMYIVVLASSSLWILLQVYLFHIGLSYVRALRRATLWHIVALKQGVLKRQQSERSSVDYSASFNAESGAVRGQPPSGRQEEPVTTWEQQ